MERHFEKDLNELKKSACLWMGSLAERLPFISPCTRSLEADEQLRQARSR